MPCQDERKCKVMNWTRDRVRRLARISASAALLTADLQALIHELGPEDPGKEKLTAANEELHQAEFHIDETLLNSNTVWELTDALEQLREIQTDSTPDIFVPRLTVPG